MKTISELQQEIRLLQTELTDFNNRLSTIGEELSNYKDTGVVQSVYKNIYEIAKKMPIIQHPIVNYNIAVKKKLFCNSSVNSYIRRFS